MTKPITTFDLDAHGYYPVSATFDADKNTLTLDVSATEKATPRFQRHIEKLLSVNGQLPEVDAVTHQLTYQNVTWPATISIAGRHLTQLTEQDDTLEATNTIPLSVTQKRIIGTYHASRLNEFTLGQDYDVQAFPAALEQARASITCDSHTHSSGHISAAGLLKVAKEHNAFYPLHLLKDIGIDIPKQRQIPLSEDPVNGNTDLRKRVEFAPLEPQDLPNIVNCISINALTDNEIARLRDNMAILDTEIQTFNETEVPAYKMRYPFMKNEKLLEPLIAQMARENQSQGLRSVELSYVGLERPEIFEGVHRAIRNLKNHDDTNQIQVMLKYGIPRTYNDDQIRECLDKAKIIVKSPYVTAIDFLGYEDSKTEEFIEPMREFARWAHENKSDLMFCVHAGETDKNPNNVIDALKFAKAMADEKHPITLRIGHGVYGLTEEALDIAGQLAHMQPPRVIFELNPESNMALDNVMDPSDLMGMVHEFIKRDIPFVPGSDSFGQYQSDHAQLAQTFMDVGFGAHEFAIMKQYQEDLQQRIHATVQADIAQIPEWNTDAGLKHFCDESIVGINEVSERYKDIPKPPKPTKELIQQKLNAFEARLKSQKVELIQDSNTLPKELQGKKPITLMGASGSSWARIDDGHRHEIAVAADMLLHALNPDKSFIAQGRNKDEGLSAVINAAIKRVNAEAEKTGDAKFYNLGFQADYGVRGSYGHLSHVVALRDRTKVPDAIADFTVKHDGVLAAFGGGAYTRYTITKADLRSHEEEKGWLYVMRGPAGASTDKARSLDEKCIFETGKELLQKVFKEHPECFREGLDISKPEVLEELYNQAIGRIGDQYGTPPPHGQQVCGAETIEKQRQRD